ncbi:MAG TPA: hypothetical protein VF974_04375 [Patescibacteria group bacterium]
MPLQTYQPASFGHAIIALIFYLLMVGFVLYSFLAIYSLIRFGRTKVLGLIISILYLVISASLFAAAVANLNSINF